MLNQYQDLVVNTGVHGSGWVGFVPDLDSTRIFWVGEKQNRPVIMVGSSDSGPPGFGFVSVDFGFYCWCRYFAGLVKIWPIFGWIHRIWTRSRRDLARSRWI